MVVPVHGDVSIRWCDRVCLSIINGAFNEAGRAAGSSWCNSTGNSRESLPSGAVCWICSTGRGALRSARR